MTEPTTPPIESGEASGPPIGTTPPESTSPIGVRVPITLVPPPLTLDQAEKLANVIKALEELIESLGTLGGAIARLLLGKVLEGLRAMGPIPPLGPSGGTEHPSTPPSTTP